MVGQVSDENEGDEEKVLPKYLIDFDAGEAAGRSLPALIASPRACGAEKSPPPTIGVFTASNRRGNETSWSDR